MYCKFKVTRFFKILTGFWVSVIHATCLYFTQLVWLGTHWAWVHQRLCHNEQFTLRWIQTHDTVEEECIPNGIFGM